MKRAARIDFNIENTDTTNPHINKLQIDYNYREIEKLNKLKSRVEYLEKKQLEDKELLLTALKTTSIAIEDLRNKVNILEKK